MRPLVATVAGALVASATVHAVLAPAHLAEGSPLGVAFVAAAVALAAVALALALTRGGGPAVAAAVGLLSVLVAAYGVEGAFPRELGHGHEHAEGHLDRIAVPTKFVELVGVGAGLLALRTTAFLRPRAAGSGHRQRRA